MLPEIRLRNFCVCIFVTVASLVALALYVSRYSESSKRVTLRGFSGHAENDGNTANYQHHSRYRWGPHNGDNQRKLNRVVSDILGRLGVSSWIRELFLSNLPSIQSLGPEFKHLAHGRKSLHLAFLTLQGKQAASALDLVAIRRALARSMSSAFILSFKSSPKTTENEFD